MERRTAWVGAGVYVPEVYTDIVCFFISRTDDPFVGVQIDSAENAQRFSDVYIFDEYGHKVAELAQAERGK